MPLAINRSDKNFKYMLHRITSIPIQKQIISPFKMDVISDDSELFLIGVILSQFGTRQVISTDINAFWVILCLEVRESSLLYVYIYIFCSIVS